MKTIQRIIEGKPAQCVARTDTIKQACDRMAEHQIGALVVLDGEQIVGIFTERDVVTRVVRAGLDVGETPVGAVMSTELVVASPSETYAACLEKMQKARCRHLPVVADGRLAGVVSLRDLIRLEIDETREEIQILHTYISM